MLPFLGLLTTPTLTNMSTETCYLNIVVAECTSVQDSGYLLNPTFNYTEKVDVFTKMFLRKLSPDST